MELDEDSLQVDMTASQKLPVRRNRVKTCVILPAHAAIPQTSLRQETLKAVMHALHKNLSESIWERLFSATAGDLTPKKR
jgi:hypothetical protein